MTKQTNKHFSDESGRTCERVRTVQSVTESNTDQQLHERPHNKSAERTHRKSVDLSDQKCEKISSESVKGIRFFLTQEKNIVFFKKLSKRFQSDIHETPSIKRIKRCRIGLAKISTR